MNKNRSIEENNEKINPNIKKLKTNDRKKTYK